MVLLNTLCPIFLTSLVLFPTPVASNRCFITIIYIVGPTTATTLFVIVPTCKIKVYKTKFENTNWWANMTGQPSLVIKTIYFGQILDEKVRKTHGRAHKAHTHSR